MPRHTPLSPIRQLVNSSICQFPAWQYLDGSHLKGRLTYPNGVTADYTYEPNRDLLAGVRNHRGETLYSEHLYANDALGRRTAKNDERYGYNGRSELVSAATNGTNDYAYAYDDIGNRKSSVELGTNSVYTANALNQYTAVGRVAPRPPEDDFAPQYDADGNQTPVKTSTGTWSVEYNAENRPIRWTRGNTVVTMDFDSMGRRTFYRETENGRQVTFTRFFYDGYLMIQQLFSNSPYNIYKEFIWDPTEPVATKPLCFRQNGQAATFLTHDGNKNVTDVIRVAPYNDLVGHYEYAPFGAVRSQTGSRASANPYRFSSEFADDTLGLVYYNYRHYEPMTGRWLSRDPIADYERMYLFCHNCGFKCDYLGLVDYNDIIDELNRIIDALGDEHGFPTPKFPRNNNEQASWIEMLFDWFFERGDNPAIFDEDDPHSIDIANSASIKEVKKDWCASGGKKNITSWVFTGMGSDQGTWGGVEWFLGSYSISDFTIGEDCVATFVVRNTSSWRSGTRLPQSWQDYIKRETGLSISELVASADRGEVLYSKLKEKFPTLSHNFFIDTLMRLLPSYGGNWEQVYKVRADWRCCDE